MADFFGTAGADVIASFRGIDTSGDDLISTGDGNDYIIAGTGQDTVLAGNGNDVMVDDDGMSQDTYNGGAGTDQVQYTSAGTFDFNVAGADQFVGVEILRFLSNAGVDVTTTNQNWQVVTGAGDDQVTGGTGNDRITTGAGDDTLNGGAGGDRLEAGADNDTLNGGKGNDLLVGGAGSDTFVFNLADIDANDTIADFNAADDFIQFDGAAMSFYTIGSDTAEEGSNPFLLYNATSGQLFIDQNGNDAGGLLAVALLQGAPALTQDNFVFDSLMS